MPRRWIALVAGGSAVDLLVGLGLVLARSGAPSDPVQRAAEQRPTTVASAAVHPVLDRRAASGRRPAAGHVARPAASLPYPLPAAAVQPEPCPPPPRPPGPPVPPLGRPKVAERDIPPAPLPGPRRVALGPVTGKGIWLTLWPGDRLDARAVVAAAVAAGLHQLWVRTGSSTDGFYGAGYLAALLPVAHAAGIAVVAWDFPTLSDPRADANRAARAIAAGADAFSADIETADEGTYLSRARVTYYLSLVRAAAGNRPVVATVPAPSAYHLSFYPYSAMVPYVDAFAPMVYWSCEEPGRATASAMAMLQRWRPVAPIGQSYDMGPEGGRPGLPAGAEIWRFLDVAHRHGAIGASLYLYSQTRAAQWRALGGYPWPGRPSHRLTVG
jgi:hypothetical protein